MERPTESVPAWRRGEVFNQIADEYDRGRWMYPDQIIDRACQIADIGSGDRVLEVGCGTGQLTCSLAARALDVTAIDPGEQLILLAERNLKAIGKADFVNARFEDAPLAGGHFRTLFSASAFHWVDPDVSWRKAARILAPGGTIALIQYCGIRDPRASDDEELLLSALTTIAPEIAAAWPRSRELAAILAGVGQRRDNISEAWAWLGNYDIARSYVCQLFGEVQIAAAAPNVTEHTAEKLDAVMRTTSFYTRLSAEQREALRNEYTAIHERLGRPIRSSTAAILVTARCRTAD